MAISTTRNLHQALRFFQHFIEQVRGLTGSVYGRRMYEVMRFWDDDHPEWAPELRDFRDGVA